MEIDLPDICKKSRPTVLALCIAYLFALMVTFGIAVADNPETPTKESTTMPGATDQNESKTSHSHTNKLINATSPYLLQHAHNPVDWYEWGEEALARAKKENKPIFLSIGYSACHWCHVMERESFENEDIAAVMNEHFVNIKVDREERPDLDDIYMSATQALTRSGGWPMSVWLTPDLKPFYAGTYFPPESRYGRPGFKDVLLFLSKTWKDEREKILTQANELTKAVQQITVTNAGQRSIPANAVENAVNQVLPHFDENKGGIISGGTNKFPPSMALQLLMRDYHRTALAGRAASNVLDIVDTTLENMAYGGIYDHIGGGIARYSTDADWLVPHFEKMLYDQALVADSFTSAYQLTKNPLYAEKAIDICNYVINDLQSPEGGFYSSRDADSEGEEGKFYVWTDREIYDVLGNSEAGFFARFYDVTSVGNWEGKNILHVPNEPAAVAAARNLDVDDVKRRLAVARDQLFVAREQRTKPHRDEKILSGWNGLMISAMAKGARVFHDDRLKDSAIRAADFVLSKMTDDKGRLLRTYRDGKKHTLGYLDDYAIMIEALLDLYETTFDLKWLLRAESLNDQLMRHYLDDTAGGFYFTANDAETVLVRMKNANDTAVPSGNSVQFTNLLRLAVLLDRREYVEEVQKMMKVFGDKVATMPFGSERLLAGADFFHRPPKEIAIIHDNKTKADAEKMIDAVWAAYIPNRVIAVLNVDDPQASDLVQKVPLLRDKKLIDGKATAYICQNFTCRQPVTDIDSMLEQIGVVPPPVADEKQP